MEADNLKLVLEEALLTCMTHLKRDGGQGPDSDIDLATLLDTAVRTHHLPSDADMEHLERKAAIVRALNARYARDWTPRKAEGKAPAEVLVGAAALFLLDAALATDRARALKRLNAALWIMQSEDWKNDAPAAAEVTAVAERLTTFLTEKSRWQSVTR